MIDMGKNGATLCGLKNNPLPQIVIRILVACFVVLGGCGYSYALDIPVHLFTDADYEAFCQKQGVVCPSRGTKRSKTITIDKPSVLDEPDCEYVLANDIVAETTGITIAASDITLNLNGHTIEYGAGGKPASYGVFVEGYNRKGLEVLNGLIVQSANVDSNNPENIDCSPVFIPHHISSSIFSGLHIKYHSFQTHGVFIPWGTAEISCCVIEDSGKGVANRHSLVSAIAAGRGDGMVVRNNFIKRTRQVGIQPGEDNSICENNLVNIESVDTNSAGIIYYGDPEFTNDRWVAKGNRVRGIGVHPIGIASVSDTMNGVVESNHIQVMCTATSKEYNEPIGSAGFRVTWGGDKIIVRGNHFEVLAAEGAIHGSDSWGRSVWVSIKKDQEVVIESNTIIARSHKGDAKAAAVAVCANNESSGLVVVNNDIYSTWANFLLADDYGASGGFPQFIGNNVYKDGDSPSYKTIVDGYANYESTGVFVDNAMHGGATVSNLDINLSSKALKDVRLGSTYRVRAMDLNGVPVEGAAIKVRDSQGLNDALYRTDENGFATVVAIDTVYSNGNMKTFDRILGLVGKRQAALQIDRFQLDVSWEGGHLEKEIKVGGIRNIELALQ